MVEKLKLLKSAKTLETTPNPAPTVGRVVDMPETGYLLVKVGSEETLRARIKRLSAAAQDN